MGEEQAATLDGQFLEFSTLMDNKRSGKSITIYRSDFWMRQAKILDDRKVTMTDTGILFNKYSKTELNSDEWLEFLKDLCELKNLDEEKTRDLLTNCGLPGQVPVFVPQWVANEASVAGVVHCPPVFDSFLCWPPTPAGEIARQSCPAVRLSDTSRLAFRVCGDSGLWLGRRANVSNQIGWTNYTPCFPQEVNKLFSRMTDDTAQMTFRIAKMTRFLEIIGLSFSLIALLVSLFIFSYYRALRNDRTRIHKSLFCAILVQVCIRLTLYIDQAYVRSYPDNTTLYDNFTVHGIDNMPYVCEITYSLLEYAVTVMFMWMFVEGLYLHNRVSLGVLRARINHGLYFALGWGLPILLTIIWATATAEHFRKQALKQCWYGYNFLPIYWIVQGPRMAVVIVNLLFLINIMKVLVMKLRRRATSEINKLWKAARAAMFLLPLLGITNAFEMIAVPLESSVWQFAVWSIFSHFLRAFQGFFISILYCFINNEVRKVIKKQYRDHRAMREANARNATPYCNDVNLFDLPPPPTASRRRRLFLINKPNSPPRETGYIRNSQVPQCNISIETEGRSIGLREICAACNTNASPFCRRQLEDETNA